MTTTDFLAALREDVGVLQAQHPVLANVLSRAHALVHDGHVFVEEDGHSAMVRSSTDATRWYHVNGSCPCDASHFAPGHPCKHRTAVRLYARVSERLTESPDDERWEPVEASSTPTPPALPEAPASVNVRLQIDGRDCQLTLRDHDEARLLQRLAAVLAQYPAPAQPPASQAPQGQGKDWCAVHQTVMQWNAGKEGRKGWYSHKVDGQWCKGK